MKVEKIMIRNFKCINELSIELAPLTIFVGKNGSGKTSILEAIALFAQSNKRSLNEAVKKCELVNFEEIKDIYYKRDPTNELALGFEVKLNKGEIEEVKGWLKEMRERWKSKKKEELMVKEAEIAISIVDKISSELKNSPRASYEHIIQRGEVYVHIFKIGNFVIKCPFEGNRSQVEVLGFPLIAEAPNYSCFLPENIYFYTNKTTIFDLEKLTKILQNRIGYVERDRKIFYISANRGSFPWEYEGVGKDEVGVDGKYTIEVISKILAERNLTKINDLEFFCSLFGIDKIWSGWKKPGDILTSAYLDPFVGSPYSLRFPHLGSGSKQILPLITQIVKEEVEEKESVEKKGAEKDIKKKSVEGKVEEKKVAEEEVEEKDGILILVEEPELSMHPEYQTRLPFLFAHALKKGHQMIVTTHSSYLVLALGTAIQGEKLTPDKYGVPEEREIKLEQKDVLVYQIDRDEGGVKIKRLEFGEDGFIKEGIPTFVDVERKLFERIF